ncbi:unnamed protein product [Trichobilharzia regenti]|nr:unnamed protein product [Trichobilharzia regenti]
MSRSDQHDPTFGEPDTVDDYPATSSPHKTAHSPSNLDDSDSECFEVMVSPTSVFPPKTSHLDTPVYHRPVTITHSLHKTPSEGSVHISDDEDDNSSVSSDSEEKKYVMILFYQEIAFIHIYFMNFQFTLAMALVFDRFLVYISVLVCLTDENEISRSV